MKVYAFHQSLGPLGPSFLNLLGILLTNGHRSPHSSFLMALYSVVPCDLAVILRSKSPSCVQVSNIRWPDFFMIGKRILSQKNDRCAGVVARSSSMTADVLRRPF